ncbi:MAG: helix-turn-helix transcriptional regulator [Clostridiales bacterium]|jgi:YesN/AraC family two-component response regulator|nr:helix-turn-helix transcriptional regulator [Clostridiales bacterium]
MSEISNNTGNRKTANMVLSRTRRNQVYLPYMRKKPYFDAIIKGDADTIAALSQKNYEYPTALFNRCGTYSEAMEKMYYESVCAASEMCIVAIQAGLLDMVAYDIRDEFIKEFDNAVALPDLYDLVHGMAHNYAVKMKYLIREKKYSPRLIKMMTYIEEHLTEKIELAQIAEHVNLSRTYASAIFKEELGITLSEFIMNERMLEAKRMLRDTDLNVATIADRLAFCSQSYFTKNFTDSEGMTPVEYRRKYGV